MSDINPEYVSDETKAKIAEFTARQAQYQELYNRFQDENQEALMQLDNAREELNAVLDDAKRGIRDDATRADYRQIKKLRVGNFSVAKKWSSWYIVEGFIDIIKDLNLFDAAVDEGVIKIETKIDGKLAPEFLRKNSVESNFKIVEDGKELTPAVTCPKPVAAFGGVLK